MMRRWIVRAVLVVAAVAATLVYRPDKAIRVGTGLTAKMICSQTFVSGFDPKEVFEQSIAANPGTDILAPLLRYTVDREKRQVDASLAGLFYARAVERKGLGLSLIHI